MKVCGRQGFRTQRSLEVYVIEKPSQGNDTTHCRRHKHPSPPCKNPQSICVSRNPVVRNPIVALIPPSWTRQLFVLAQLTVSSAAAAQRRSTVLTGKRGGEGLASQF